MTLDDRDRLIAAARGRLRRMLRGVIADRRQAARLSRLAPIVQH